MHPNELELAKLFGRRSEIDKFFEEHGVSAERSDAADLPERLGAVLRECFNLPRESGGGSDADLNARLEALIPDVAMAAKVVGIYVSAASVFAKCVERSRSPRLSVSDRAEYINFAKRIARKMKEMQPVVEAWTLFCALLAKVEDNLIECQDLLADEDFGIRTKLAILEAETSILAKKLSPDAG